MRPIALALALAFTALPAVAAPIDGRWITEDGKAIVAIAVCGDARCGRVQRILAPAPEGAPVDANNPDPALRARPIQGMTVLTGLVADGARWRGRIYSPEEGRTYRAVLWRNAEGGLQMKGCIAIFCRGETWRPAR